MKNDWIASLTCLTGNDWNTNFRRVSSATDEQKSSCIAARSRVKDGIPSLYFSDRLVSFDYVYIISLYNILNTFISLFMFGWLSFVIIWFNCCGLQISIQWINCNPKSNRRYSVIRLLLLMDLETWVRIGTNPALALFICLGIRPTAHGC